MKLKIEGKQLILEAETAKEKKQLDAITKEANEKDFCHRKLSVHNKVIRAGFPLESLN